MTYDSKVCETNDFNIMWHGFWWILCVVCPTTRRYIPFRLSVRHFGHLCARICEHHITALECQAWKWLHLKTLPPQYTADLRIKER